MSAPTIKIIAVENDTTYADSLSLIISELGYELVGIVDNALAAMKLVEETLPDLILMDTDITDSINGTALAERINENRRIPIISMTAFKEQQTFHTASATFSRAFIIKPYDPVSMQSAIELAIFTQPVPNATVLQPQGMGDTFYIKDNGRLVKIRLRDILMAEADEKYCFVVTDDTRHLINMRLKELLERLPHEDFIQVHSSFAVRKSAIKSVNLGEQTVLVANQDIPVGKAYRERLLSTLKLLS